jgi:hypothetical protein
MTITRIAHLIALLSRRPELRDLDMSHMYAAEAVRWSA